MPGAVQLFRQEHAARIRIITAPNSTLLNQLRVGELDLVIGRLARPREMQGLSFTHLYSEPLVLVVRANHPLPPDAAFDVAQLEGMTVLIPTIDGIMRPVIDRFLIANGIGALPDCIEARSPEFCRQYIATSDAVWIVSRGVVEPDVHRGTFRLLNFDTSDTQGAVGFTTRADSEPSPTVRLLMDTIARTTAALAPSYVDSASR